MIPALLPVDPQRHPARPWDLPGLHRLAGRPRRPDDLHRARQLPRAARGRPLHQLVQDRPDLVVRRHRDRLLLRARPRPPACCDLKAAGSPGSLARPLGERPSVIVGIMWKLFFQPQAGILNEILRRLHLPGDTTTGSRASAGRCPRWNCRRLGGDAPDDDCPAGRAPVDPGRAARGRRRRRRGCRSASARSRCRS